MEDAVQLIFTMFLKALKKSKLGFGVMKDGTFVFECQKTGEKVAFKSEDIEKAYNKM